MNPSTRNNLIFLLKQYIASQVSYSEKTNIFKSDRFSVVRSVDEKPNIKIPHMKEQIVCIQNMNTVRHDWHYKEPHRKYVVVSKSWCPTILRAEQSILITYRTSYCLSCQRRMWFTYENFSWSILHTWYQNWLCRCP